MSVVSGHANCTWIGVAGNRGPERQTVVAAWISMPWTGPSSTPSTSTACTAVLPPPAPALVKFLLGSAALALNGLHSAGRRSTSLDASWASPSSNVAMRESGRARTSPSR